jgi:hypothetical protein
MKLTKDESRILAILANEAKYNLNNRHSVPGLIDALTTLENKLFEAGKDQRRTGRTSLNDFTDCLKRFVKNNKEE